LPEGAERLASSHLYREQAFRWGNSYGVQFHAEISEDLLSLWFSIPEYRESLSQARGLTGMPTVLVDEFRVVSERLQAGRRAPYRWVD